ncbi:MAG: hypothetical protein AAB728_00735 [Patescibacteria group bacterium]
MKRFLSLRLFLLSLLPAVALAQGEEPRHLNVPGVELSILQVMQNFVTVAVAWIVPLTVTLFLVGAIMMVGGAGSEPAAKRGKTLMIGSLAGMAIVLLAAVIIKFVLYVVFAPPA